MTFTEVIIGIVVELFFVLIAAAVLYWIWSLFFPTPARLVVPPLQRGVVIRDSQVEKVLGPGAYWIGPKRRLLLCDVRPIPFQVPSVELLTADGLAVRIGLGGECRVCDPGLFVTASGDAFGAFYVEVRQALRVAVAELTSDRLLASHVQVVSRIRELVIPRAAQLGIEMLQLDVHEAVPVGWLRPL